MYLKEFINDAKIYYRDFFGLEIPKLYRKKKVLEDLDVFSFIDSYLSWKELKEMYLIGKEEYHVDITFNDFLLYLCEEYDFSYRRIKYKIERSSFRQEKNNKVEKKHFLDKKTKKEKQRKGNKKSWKKSYKKASLKRGKKAYRNWTKKEIKRLIRDDNYNYNYTYSINSGKDYNFANPWDWD